MVPDEDGGGLTDCWYWNGEPWRGVDDNAANGSGVRAGGAAGWEKFDGGGVDIWGGVEAGPAANRSLIALAEVLCCACDRGTAIPDIPRTDIDEQMRI